jgi:hypothetical protein
MSSIRDFLLRMTALTLLSGAVFLLLSCSSSAPANTSRTVLLAYNNLGEVTNTTTSAAFTFTHAALPASTTTNFSVVVNSRNAGTAVATTDAAGTSTTVVVTGINPPVQGAQELQLTITNNVAVKGVALVAGSPNTNGMPGSFTFPASQVLTFSFAYNGDGTVTAYVVNTSSGNTPYTNLEVFRNCATSPYYNNGDLADGFASGTPVSLSVPTSGSFPPGNTAVATFVPSATSANYDSGTVTVSGDVYDGAILGGSQVGVPLPAWVTTTLAAIVLMLGASLVPPKARLGSGQ